MSILTDLSNSLADAVEAVTPSLVNVDARRGYGATGLAWKREGLVITANHVVQRDENITIATPGGEPVAAQIVGRDRATDIAVLRTDSTLASTVEPVTNEPRVGNLVLALGTYSGEPPSASFGVIATIDRPFRGHRGRSIEELIRSDVTLYPGFSGGPLVDASGRVAGMNTSALTRGLAATIPWRVLERIADTLVNQGSLKRGYLGVISQPVEIPGQMRSSAGIEQESGLLVIAVEQGSPSEKAGLIVGDILVQVDSRTIAGIEDLQEWLAETSVGHAAAISILRGGSQVELGITVGER